jgi:tRNA modification GTPase
VGVLDVWNKADAAPPMSTAAVPAGGVVISAQTGAGLPALRRALLEQAGWHAAPEGVFIARARHVSALREARAHLDEAAAQLEAPVPALELLAEELRLAHEALGAITGAFTPEDLLGSIFSRFCIGK